MASENVENYLKSIFLMEAGGGRVSTSSLSDKLQISPASVSEMVKRLADGGHVVHTPYKGVQLTEKGRRKAVRIIRLHRLWELFLVKVLNYSWDEIHDEAELLEHITSDKLERRLDEFLGFPTIDPHGDVIPTATGIVNGGGSLPLSQTNATTVVVRRVSDENPEILKYADRLGISLNKVVDVVEKNAFDGSFRVRIGGKEQFISGKLAEKVFVDPARNQKRKRNG
jgi:DtxR family Mn-dependent transcriptional regulator